MTDTEHSVEPIRAQGGLRRLRLGNLGTERTTNDAVLSMTRFREALEGEIRRSVLDDHTLVVAAVTVWSVPGAEPVGHAGELQTEVLARLRSVNDNIRAAHQADNRLLLLIPSIRRRPDGELVVNRLRAALDEPVLVDGIHHHLNPRIGAAMLDLDSPSSDLVI
ncbi:MAG: hypothetical protein AAFO29_27020, partial [Actinomycetota bacterium]